MRQPVFRLLLSFVVLFFGFVSPLRAEDCQGAALPSETDRNIWYCWTDSDTAIVFVHGLHSSSRTAWLNEKSPSVYWPALAASDPALNKPAVFLAGFFTGTESTTFGMRDAAGSLFAALSSPSGGHAPVLSKRNILFVAHSLGGILTRDMLTRYRQDFAGKRAGLLLVASPSSGADAAKWLDSTLNAAARSRMLNELSFGSRYLQNLDDDFKTMLKDRAIVLEGREIFEQYFVQTGSGSSWIPTSITRRLAPLVPMDKTVKYFADPQLIPESDHITIAKPDRLSHLSHQKLAQVYGLMLAAPAPACDAPPDFEIALSVATADTGRGLNPEWPDAVKAVLPQYKFVRHLGDLDIADRRPVPRDSESGRYFYKPKGVFPCKGEKFSATFYRVPPESHMSTAASATGLCFTRSLARPNDKGAGFGCAEGEACKIANGEAGLADACPASQGWLWQHLISPAYAAPVPEGAHWSVPSLESMQAMPEATRPGYAEFTVTSHPRTGLAEATSYSTGITVNGVELYVDGLPAHAEHLPFTARDGLNHTFALENLGFTGGEDGHETIALEIKYWKGKTLIATDTISRDDYISYRHAEEASVKDTTNGGDYVWGGYYRPAQAQTAYEVMLATNPDPDGILKTKDGFNKGSRDYNGKPVVGVIRPGRKDNTTYGMTFGIRLPTGQVKSLFSEEEAKAICKWAGTAAGIPGWMRKAAYLYRFPASAFTDRTDRGQYAGECSKVAG